MNNQGYEQFGEEDSRQFFGYRPFFRPFPFYRPFFPFYRPFFW